MEDLLKVLRQDYYNNDFSRKLIDAEEIFYSLLRVCGDCSWGQLPCFKSGSYLIDGVNGYTYDLEMYPKQLLLYETAKNINSALEIGVYMGHSLLIMLLANPKLKILCIDSAKELSGKCINIIKNYFPEAEIEFIPGNSLDILPNLEKKFDFFHIDGGHSVYNAVHEFNYCKRLSNNKNIKLIFDDIGIVGGVKDELKKHKIIQEIEPKCPLTKTPWYINYYIEIEL